MEFEGGRAAGQHSIRSSPPCRRGADAKCGDTSIRISACSGAFRGISACSGAFRGISACSGAFRGVVRGWISAGIGEGSLEVAVFDVCSAPAGGLGGAAGYVVGAGIDGEGADGAFSRGGQGAGGWVGGWMAGASLQAPPSCTRLHLSEHKRASLTTGNPVLQSRPTASPWSGSASHQAEGEKSGEQLRRSPPLLQAGGRQGRGGRQDGRLHAPTASIALHAPVQHPNSSRPMLARPSCPYY